MKIWIKSFLCAVLTLGIILGLIVGLRFTYESYGAEVFEVCLFFLLVIVELILITKAFQIYFRDYK